MKEKIIGSLQGIAIGDAFGLGLEFKSRHWIQKNVLFDTFLDARTAGPEIEPGTYSDDTEHTIGVIEALLSSEEFSKDLLLEKFKDEYENDLQKKGFPRAGHGSIEKWYTGKKTIEEVRAMQAEREDPGNAPVMRALPLCFIDKGDVYRYACINADATHPHELGRQASFLTVLTAWHFLREDGDRDDLIDFLLGFVGNTQQKIILQKIDKLPKPKLLTQEDYRVLHGVQPLPYIKWDTNIYGMPCAAMKTALNVVYVMKHAESAFDALKISINMGGDVDSLAAVCTGIASGKYGNESLPDFLFAQTEGLERLADLGSQLHTKYFA
ncbi:MAG: ADP-ribosylglycohydrolase family protein [Candidatus Pacebacteria bacterium]|nr:ADP-ribosylglycohydrolase family protein [Candidatus Paceibacterota bacterium]